MLKRISVSQLQVGMYLEEFCCSWMEHPFWRSGFVIADNEDIRRIRSSNVSEVWIDTSKGIEILPDSPSLLQADVEARIDAEFGQISLDSPVAGTPADNADYVHAASVCAAARQTVKALFEEARMGRTINIPEVENLVGEIIESVSRNHGAITSLVRLKSASDFTYMHSVAVCVLMVTLARQLALDDRQTRAAGLAGLLHDLGLATLPSQLLHKPGKLDDDEFAVIRRHPKEGSLMLQESGVDPIVLDVCLNHHARVDGSGYPTPRKGNEISLFSRMAAICDVYDAISSGRPYKEAWDPAESMRKMAEWTKGQFDPVVFHAFVKSVGIYPVGALVRLSSGRLGVVTGQSGTSLLTPQVKVFFSTLTETRIPPITVDLSDPLCSEQIEAREDPAKWHFSDLPALWTGLSSQPW